MRKFVSFFGAHTPVFDEVNARAKEYAKERGFDYSWVVQKPYCKEEVIACLKESDVGLIDVEPYDASIFSQVHERCKLLVRFGVGFDKVNLKDASQYGICCARTTGTLSDSVAELALTQILACRRQLRSNRAVVESGVWDKGIGNETTHKTVGIVGFGAIGQTLAKLLSGFDCQILAYDPYPNTEKMQQLGVTPCSLEELVERSDAISIHVPYTPQTHHLFDAERIGKMKPTAVLVCTARGNIIDEDALYEALKARKIAGAALDVFSVEPLPVPSRLTELDNLILTPHVASQTVEAIWAVYKKAIDIAADFFAGKPLQKADLLNPDYNAG